MTLLRATITGNLREAMGAEVRKVSGALRRAVTTAGQQVQGELRAQARAAGFKDGGRAVANTWRLRVFPGPGVAQTTFKPAALVYSRMPSVVEAFDKGATIQAKGGAGADMLAFPTGYNATGGRRSAGRRGGLRVTLEQMQQATKRKEAFYLRSKSNPRVVLWCLRITQENRTKRRISLFVGRGVEVVTGRRKGLQQRRREILAQGFVPMFFLMRQVSLRKRLNTDQVRAMAPRWFAAAATAELARLPA